MSKMWVGKERLAKGRRGNKSLPKNEKEVKEGWQGTIETQRTGGRGRKKEKKMDPVGTLAPGEKSGKKKNCGCGPQGQGVLLGNNGKEKREVLSFWLSGGRGRGKEKAKGGRKGGKGVKRFHLFFFGGGVGWKKGILARVG